MPDRKVKRMVYSVITEPFADAGQQQLFEAVAAALQAEPNAPTTLLLGRPAVATAAEVPIEAVVLRPHSITLLLLVPEGGHLSVPALGYGAWLLGGRPLPAGPGCDNPFEQYVQQKAALATWLAEYFPPEQANLRFISGVLVFGAPVTFGPDVEPALNAPQAAGFELLAQVADLPRRLRQLATPEIDLDPADLAEWAASLGAAPALADNLPAASAGEDPAAPATAPAGTAALGAPAGPTDYLTQKARQLWGWLGAADVPDEDPPYGYDPAAAAEARRQEQAQLEQLRQQLQADVAAQLSRMEARETERERSMAQLRAELAQAPAVAPEAAHLEAQLAAESREKAAQQAAMRASEAEAATRSQELAARIEQLGQLIERLSAQAAAPASSPASPGPEAPAEAPANPAPPARPAAATLAAPAIPQAPPAPGPATPAAPATSATTPPLQPRPGAQPRGASFDWRAALAARSTAAWQVARPWLAQSTAWLQPGGRWRLMGAGLLALAVGWGVLRYLAGGPAPVPYQENGRWGFADASGQPVIAAQFSAAGAFQDGWAVVARRGAYGIINEAGKEVVAPAYDALNPFAGGYARARVGDMYTFLNEQGQEFDTYYFNALDFAEGRAAVLDHRGWHYIDGPTEPTQPVVFAEAYSFAEGLARVKLADGYTFITPAYLTDPGRGTKPFGRYELATDFADGKARVTQHGRSFFIDKEGQEVR